MNEMFVVLCLWKTEVTESTVIENDMDTGFIVTH